MRCTTIERKAKILLGRPNIRVSEDLPSNFTENLHKDCTVALKAECWEISHLATWEHLV